jgi:hypothetical protein
MAEVLLLNPRSRKRRSSGSKKRRTSTARRRNPIAALRRAHGAVTRRRARRTTAGRRRRNPIGLSMAGGRGMFGQLMPVAVGAVGAVALDAIYAKISPHLPASLQRVPGKVGAGDLVKLGLTLAAGKFLNRATKGLAAKAAAGAALVQVYNIVANMVPAGTLGWYSPYPVVRGNARVGPTRLNAFTAGGTPLLSGAPGRTGMSAFVGTSSPLLSGVNSARTREGYIR